MLMYLFNCVVVIYFAGLQALFLCLFFVWSTLQNSFIHVLLEICCLTSSQVAEEENWQQNLFNFLTNIKN